MFNELSFLTTVPALNNNDNKDTIYNNLKGEPDKKSGIPVFAADNSKSNTIIMKDGRKSNTSNIKNYYKSNVYKGQSDFSTSDKNPYLKLIVDFEKDGFQAMRFQPADFAYLTDLGVYPINRMWVLRRYEDQQSPPNNLQMFTKPFPYAKHTLVGWIKPEEEHFFNVSFHEKWHTVTDRLDETIMKILDEEFGFKAGAAVSLPGWSQGLLFGFLKQMGLTDYNGYHIPQGDPAFLQEAAARAKDANPDYCNESSMNIKLSTSYEQKFIGNIDPGSAMSDIMQKCINMGTRDTKYVLNDTSGSGIINSLKAANNSGNDIEAWWTFIQNVITAFTDAIKNVFKDISGNILDPNKKTTTEKPTEAQNKSDKDNADAKKNDKSVPKPDTNEQATALTKSLDILKGGATNDFLKKILSSTVAKWRYVMMGSIALMTGENSTPWHLTLGNPYSPFVSLGNIIVEDISLNYNNEFAFNDMPTRLDVEVKIKFGRNLGAQEIFSMFNNGYKRDYNSQQPPTTKSTAPITNTAQTTPPPYNYTPGADTASYNAVQKIPPTTNQPTK